MSDTIIFKSLREYAEFVTDVINTKQPALDSLDVRELDDGSIEVKLNFARVD